MSAAKKRAPHILRPVGNSEFMDASVADPADPRYGEWDLERFRIWASHELKKEAGSARAKVKHGGNGVMNLPPQQYYEVAEFAGFAFIDGDLTIRKAHSRTGLYWLGGAMSIVWKPGEQGAKEQLMAVAAEHGSIAFAALWWSDAGLVSVRFVDTIGGHALGSAWEVRPPRGGWASTLRALGAQDENTVGAVSDLESVNYSL